MKKTFFPWRSFIFLLLIFPILRAAPVPGADSPEARVADPAKKHWKILHIMSYHSPWKWTDGQFDGFKAALQGLDIEYKVFQMDMKRRTGEAWKQEASRAARELIDSWKPDLVYTSDDYAQKYVAEYYLNQKLPFVFSGVNADPSSYGFVGSTNITGVLEEEHIVETIRLLRQIVPTVNKIAIIYDDDPTWPPVLARIKKSLPHLQGLNIISWDLIHTFAQFKQRIVELQKEVDAIGFLGIFTFKDEHGNNVSYKTVCRWVLDHSNLPDFSFWEDRIAYGTLCAVNVSEYEQGYAAGQIARGILVEGRSPASYPMKPTVKGVPMVNLLRAKKLGIRIKTGILLSVTVRDSVNKDF
ncbi:MAG: hypothetical protein M0P73_05820 [Syntrophobacterales bacterium]|jgi:ABC-type uncharacterized transport system substrate-binding protein|nr:hypothetical protein [Syntrophobacterales bacterium]